MGHIESNNTERDPKISTEDNAHQSLSNSEQAYITSSHNGQASLKKGKRRFSYYLVILLFLLLILSVVILAWLFSLQQQETQQLKMQWSQWRTEQQQLNQSSLDSQQQQLTNFAHQQEKQTAQLQQLTQQADLQQQQEQFAWQQAQVFTLIQTADQRMRLAHDYLSAEQLLIQAQQMAEATTIIDLKTKLEQAITQLQQQNAQIQQFHKVVEQSLAVVANLPLQSAPQSQQHTTTMATTNPLQGSWRQQLNQLWQQFKSLIRVRISQPAEPLILLREQQSARLALTLAFNQAEMALFNQDPVSWHSALAQAEQLLQQYFDVDNAEVKHLLADINALQQQNWSINLPDLTPLLNQLGEKLAVMPNTTVNKDDTLPAITAPSDTALNPPEKEIIPPKYPSILPDVDQLAPKSTESILKTPTIHRKIAVEHTPMSGDV